uniref:IS110 family transposase n=1 Tax=candidate division WOR-3 bacterium TaxID=2052148 RepID=A0A7V3NUR0_UNCW3
MKRRNYNRKLKGIFFNIAFTAISIARRYYEKKRKEGKTHRKALLCLARQYLRISYTVLKKQKFYSYSIDIES